MLLCGGPWGTQAPWCSKTSACRVRTHMVSIHTCTDNSIYSPLHKRHRESTYYDACLNSVLGDTALVQQVGGAHHHPAGIIKLVIFVLDARTSASSNLTNERIRTAIACYMHKSSQSPTKCRAHSMTDCILFKSVTVGLVLAIYLNANAPSTPSSGGAAALAAVSASRPSVPLKYSPIICAYDMFHRLVRGKSLVKFR